MSEGHKGIAVRMGSGFASIVAHYLPDMDKYVTRTKKKLRVGAEVELSLDPKSGLVVGKLITKPPKIELDALDTTTFVLDRAGEGQLEFTYAGTIAEFTAALPSLPVPGSVEVPGDDDYTPGDNTQERE